MKKEEIMGKARVLGGVLKWNVDRVKRWVDRSLEKSLALEIPLVGGLGDGGAVVVIVDRTLTLPLHMAIGECLYHLDEEMLVYIECGSRVGVR